MGLWDTSVSIPFRGMQLGCLSISRSKIQKPLRAALAAKARKKKTYAILRKNADLSVKYELIPISFESSGSLEESAVQFLKYFARESVAVTEQKETYIYYKMMNQIFTTLYREVVGVLSNRVYGLMCPKESGDSTEGLLLSSSDTLVYNGEEDVIRRIRVVYTKK